MATFAFTDAVVTVNSVDLSDHVRQVTLNVSAAELENTSMGSTFRTRQGGLKDWTITLEFNQDFAAAEVDATLWPLVGTNTTVTVKPTSSATSATNPLYSGSVLVSGYNPLTNGVGDLATTSVTWQGNGTLTRATA